MTPSLAYGECIWNPLALKPGGAIVREREREGEREKEGERENMMAYTGSLNNLPILIRYCDTAEQKTRLKMNQT